MVVEVISKYLATNKRLVVPNLGTFIVKKANEEILFSNLMKNDDGVLHGLLVAEGLSNIEAAGTIDRFVFEATFRLQQGSACSLKNFGTLRNGENGTIHFDYQPKCEGEVLDDNLIPHQSSTVPVAADEPKSEAELQPEVAMPVENTVEEECEISDVEPAAADERGEIYDDYNDDDYDDYVESEPKEVGKSRYDDRREVLRSTSIRRDSSIKGLKYKGSSNISQGGSSYGGRSSKGIGGWLLVFVVAASLLAIGMLLWGEIFSGINDEPEQTVTISKPEPTVPNPDAEYITPIEGNK